MTDPTRYEGVVDNGTLYLVEDNHQIEIGQMDAVVDLIGGETYTLEYDEKQSAAAWLSTDDDNTITLDVREELVDWVYTEDLIQNITDTSLEQTGDSGHPIRTEVFADMVTSIWDSKGNLEA
ncbi:hypothetical protein [Natronolimnobius baerhuensis]|uniref:Uncharacterized protein n=1 Tax=Natronolimnobius baerhuensis TaxID=253108 RepID=A0A202EAD8_9EURY|nr:hypothetical protein [Natronolimnobius baerhuensis]OVE85212.1 hypothetical protein B2G88_09850 [Natronolimnobius baerhuensis]